MFPDVRKSQGERAVERKNLECLPSSSRPHDSKATLVPVVLPSISTFLQYFSFAPLQSPLFWETPPLTYPGSLTGHRHYAFRDLFSVYSNSNLLWIPTMCQKLMLRALHVSLYKLIIFIHISHPRKMNIKNFWLVSFVKENILIPNLFQPASVQKCSWLSLQYLFSVSSPLKISTVFSCGTVYLSQVFLCSEAWMCDWV